MENKRKACSEGGKEEMESRINEEMNQILSAENIYGE